MPALQSSVFLGLLHASTYHRIAPSDRNFTRPGGKADIDAFADFMRFLAPPPHLPLTCSASSGQTLFDQIGCATCHTPSDKVAWFWFCWTERGLESFVTSFWCKDAIDQTLTDYDYTDYTNAAPHLVAQNKDASDKVSALMLKLFASSIGATT